LPAARQKRVKCVSLVNSHKKSSRPGALINHSLRLVSLADVVPSVFPGAAQSALPGLRVRAACVWVTRTDAQHRLREMMPSCALLPGAAQSALPGLRVRAACPG
ncbi:MAG: hypothetical protein E6Y55_17005, partial [Klebsiella michiganensis]|nr:hypothetical protein [Klebsiella michiganensis]